MINYPCFAHCSTELSLLSAGASVQKVQKWMLCVTKHWASHNRCMSLRHPVETPPPHHGKARVLSFDWQNPWETKIFSVGMNGMSCYQHNPRATQKASKKKSLLDHTTCDTSVHVRKSTKAHFFSTGWHWGPAFSVHIIDAFKRIKC